MPPASVCLVVRSPLCRSLSRILLDASSSPSNLCTHTLRYTMARNSSTATRQPSAVISAPANASPRPDAYAAKPHHNGKGKGFMNHWPSYRHLEAPEMVKWLLWDRISGRRKDPDTTPPTVPVHKPAFLPTRQTARLRATWLGHACFFVEFPGGLRVLFDPVFEDRCSPFSFMGPKRFTEMPCQVEDIPYIDAVVISHNHYDHLSHPTVTKIRERFPGVHFFVPLGNKAWFEQLKITNVTELDWWEERDFTLAVPDASSSSSPSQELTGTFACLPAQHQSARTGWDRCQTLWASWSVTAGGKSVYFGGDTGYRTVPQVKEGEDDYGPKYADLPVCPAFREIGEMRGPFDLGLIPIGAYNPRHLMSPVHANPYDSVNIFVDTKCEKALGMHWGTWVLTEEDVMEPPRVLKDALKWKGIEETGIFDVCDIGASTEV